MYGPSNYNNYYLSDNFFNNAQTTGIPLTPLIQQGQISRGIENFPAHSLKRAGDVPLSGTAKKPRTSVENVATYSTPDNNQIILFCENEIDKNHWANANNVILNNTSITNSERIMLCNKLCSSLLNNGHFSASNTVIEDILPLIQYVDNNFSDLLNKLFIGYYNLKIYDRAEEIINQALANTSETSEKTLKATLYNNLSMLCHAQGKFSNAILAAKKGLCIQPLSEEYRGSLKANLKLAEDAQFDVLNTYLFNTLFTQNKFFEAKKVAANVLEYCYFTSNNNLEIKWSILKIKTLIELKQWSKTIKYIEQQINKFSNLKENFPEELYFYFPKMHIYCDSMIKNELMHKKDDNRSY